MHFSRFAFTFLLLQKFCLGTSKSRITQDVSTSATGGVSYSTSATFAKYWINSQWFVRFDLWLDCVFLFRIAQENGQIEH
jgi:hypothetical protein